MGIHLHDASGKRVYEDFWSEELAHNISSVKNAVLLKSRAQ
jgi:hypothetical protein